MNMYALNYLNVSFWVDMHNISFKFFVLGIFFLEKKSVFLFFFVG